MVNLLIKMPTGFAPPKSVSTRQRTFFAELNHRAREQEFPVEVLEIKCPRLGSSVIEQRHILNWLVCYLLGSGDAYGFNPDALALTGKIERQQLQKGDLIQAIRAGLKPQNLTPNQAFLFDAKWDCLHRVELGELEGADFSHVIQDIKGVDRTVSFRREKRRKLI